MPCLVAVMFVSFLYSCKCCPYGLNWHQVIFFWWTAIAICHSCSIHWLRTLATILDHILSEVYVNSPIIFLCTSSVGRLALIKFCTIFEIVCRCVPCFLYTLINHTEEMSWRQCVFPAQSVAKPFSRNLHFHIAVTLLWLHYEHGAFFFFNLHGFSILIMQDNCCCSLRWRLVDTL